MPLGIRWELARLYAKQHEWQSCADQFCLALRFVPNSLRLFADVFLLQPQRLEKDSPEASSTRTMEIVAEKMFYRAYQINFASEIDFHGITPTERDPSLPVVTIRRGTVPERLDMCRQSDSYFQVEPSRILLTIENVARYLIVDGSAITVDSHHEVESDMVRLFLLGSTMGALLYQRGLLPLHGSAIETARGAMVFVGPQGIGKSTLAAHFQQRGYRLLSDDVCVIASNSAGELQALPAFPILRLCSDAFDRLGGASKQLQSARSDGDKLVVPIASGYCCQPVKLAAIHLLSASTDQRIVIQPFRGFDRIERLFANLYRPEYLHGLANENAVMALAFKTASVTDLVEVVHDRKPQRIEELIDTLERDWQRH